MTTTYAPTSVITENWGRLQVVINNRDRTFYRGVPTIVQNWSSAEPFDDKTLTLRFPGITSFEGLNSLPFGEFNNVEIWLVDSSNQRVKSLWDGFIASHSDDLSADDNGLTVECLGSLYQADFFVKVPSFSLGNVDATYAISEELNLRAKYYGLRLNQMNWLALSGTAQRTAGSWNPLLTGWAQELLGNAFAPAYMRDGERAVGIQVDKQFGGYGILGDYFSVLTFGPRMPNYGSLTWWNATFVHLFKDDGFYCSDMYMNPTTRRQFVLNRGGGVEIRDDNVEAFSAQWRFWKGDVTGGFGNFTGGRPVSQHNIAIHSTDDDDGYRICNTVGRVACFGNAGFYGDRPKLGPRTFANGSPLTVDYIVDMVRTNSGNGYWLLSWGGRVFAYGDATPFSHFPCIDTLYTAIEVNAAGTGIWALDAKGRVQTRGTAVNYGSAGPGLGQMATTNFAMDLSRSMNGNGYVIVDHLGSTFTYGDAAYHGSGLYISDETTGGDITQWTLMKGTSRTPVARTKNTWTTDHTCTVGTPGITHSLTRDRTQLPNVFFGEGVDPNGCKWRNTKYPNFNPGTASPPLWPGYLIAVGLNDRAPGVSIWQDRMRQNGWPVPVDGVYDNYDMDACRFMQHLAGITIDGIVGPQTWATTFQPGANTGRLNSAYIAPIAIDRRVEPFRYAANGAILGKNWRFDRNVMRIETYTNYGDKSSKRDATISSTNQVVRNRDPGYYGTLTFEVDPEATSRFEIKAGQNIEYKGYRGQDILLHVTEATIDFDSMTATVTVDTLARDNETVHAMLERDRAAGEPIGTPTRPPNSAGRQTEDKIVFDCESSAGIVPWFYLGPGFWTVLRVPLGEVGSISKTEFEANQPGARFSIGVFDRIVHPSFLVRVGGGNPGFDEKYWQDFDDDRGLMIAWGNQGDMCGYSPGKEPSDGDENPDEWTGKLIDGTSWQFWSSSPPWVWVAFWADRTTAIKGRLFPGGDSGYNFSGSDAIANPMEISNTARPTNAFYL